MSTKQFSRVYMRLSVFVALVTTAYWSLLGAKIHQSNADQLVNTQLFENFNTFSHATLPGAHTFLVKWPIFLLVRLFGGTSTSFQIFTGLTVLATVSAFIYILYRIEKRPLIFGTICLALASVLLMIPAQPYAGGILPVNMAMLATRNLEYVLFIGCLILLIKYRSIKDKGFWLGILATSLLVASDKLFLMFGVAGASISLLIYAYRRQWKLTSISIDWLVYSILGGIGSLIILSVISALNITNLTSQSTSNPYAIVHGVNNIALGIYFAVSNMLTNFGANPAFDATVIRNTPHQIYEHFISLSALSYLINLVIFGIAVTVVFKLLRESFITKRADLIATRKSSTLSLMLVWTTVAAIVSFIATNHYYAADARYLTIGLFTGFVVFATYSSKRKWKPELVVIAGAVIALGILLGFTSSIHIYSDQKAAIKPVNDRSAALSQILSNHPVDTLVGDYWRVIPAKTNSVAKFNVTPLASCTQARKDLSSSVWQPDLNKKSFAYLLSLDGGNLTDYPKCSLQQITAVYGHPNASVLVSGSLSHPKEYLLFYDHGIHKTKASTFNRTKPSTVLPITVDDLPNTTCSVPTSMNVVAHQDDDLLFMNPDVQKDIKAGKCVRTVYVTAGDSGNGKYYYLSRQQGAEAAYSKMLGHSAVWVERTLMLPNHQYITIANPKGNNKITLVFMNLPDGNLKGDGFKTSNHESLSKLSHNEIKLMLSLDGQSSYGSSQLVNTLSELMHVFQPSLIRTQAANTGTEYPDHSDHTTVGSFVKRAYKQYDTEQYATQVAIPVLYYIGYPTHEREPNIDGQDLTDKQDAFMAYAKYDQSVCSTIEQCEQTPTYGSYLSRQYQSDH